MRLLLNITFGLLCAAAAGCALPSGSQNSASALGACPAVALQQVQFMNQQMAKIELGWPKLMVLREMGVASRWDTFMMPDGRQYEVLYFGGGYPGCQGVSDTAATGMPYVFENNRLIGYGSGYFNAFVRPLVQNQ